MIRKFLFPVIVFICLPVLSQKQGEQKYALVTIDNAYGISTLEMTDPYLSPLSYSGVGINYEHLTRRFLNPNNNRVSMQSTLRSIAGVTYNPQVTSMMTYIAENYSWGIHYHFRVLPDVQILVGGLLDADLGVKMNERNVNNTYNVDLSTDLMFSGIVRYDIPTRRRVLRVAMSLQIPVLGCMFVPLEGVSYYEMLQLRNFDNTIHFSSLHNKFAIKENVFLEIPLRNSTFRLGVGSLNMKYMANDIIFIRKEYNIMVGYTRDIQIFSGRKNTPPANFISTNK